MSETYCAWFDVPLNATWGVDVFINNSSIDLPAAPVAVYWFIVVLLARNVATSLNGSFSSYPKVVKCVSFNLRVSSSVKTPCFTFPAVVYSVGIFAFFKASLINSSLFCGKTNPDLPVGSPISLSSMSLIILGK